MSERTRFQSKILLQLSRLARWCSGLARSYSSRRKGLHRWVRLRSNTCTSRTRFRKFRGTESRALDQMQAQATDLSPVVDQCGELLGILSKNKMNRNVGGFGHDPHTEPLEAYIEKNNAYCFEDQTIAEAEQMMLNAKLGEVFVVTREKLLVGTINIEAIAQGRA